MNNDLKLTLGINQPYYLPYVGLFDRMYFCDKFVINPFTKLNRSRSNHRRVKIMQLHPDAEKSFLYLTQCVPRYADGMTFLDIKLDYDFWKIQQRHATTLSYTYKRYPGYSCIKDIIEALLVKDVNNLGDYNFKLIKLISRKLGLEDKLVYLADTDFDFKKFYERVPSNFQNDANFHNYLICNYFNAENMIVGQNGPLWVKEEIFKKEDIDISYQRIDFYSYDQFSRSETFVPGLSTLDLLANLGESSAEFIGKSSKVLQREELIKTTHLTGR